MLLDSDSRHAIKVLRCKENDVIEVIDGQGKLYQATIFSITKNKIQLSDLKIIEEETLNQQLLSIAISPTKNPARLEWFVEKATEIGVRNIYPMITSRTEKPTIKTERLQQIALSATKQSKHLFLPTIFPIQQFKDLILQQHLPKQKFIACCTHTSSKKLIELVNTKEELIVFVGPESDFTTEELKLAEEQNIVPIALGKSILRTETAGVYLSSVIRMLT